MIRKLLIACVALVALSLRACKRNALPDSW